VARELDSCVREWVTAQNALSEPGWRLCRSVPGSSAPHAAVELRGAMTCGESAADAISFCTTTAAESERAAGVNGLDAPRACCSILTRASGCTIASRSFPDEQGVVVAYASRTAAPIGLWRFRRVSGRATCDMCDSRILGASWARRSGVYYSRYRLAPSGPRR